MASYSVVPKPSVEKDLRSLPKSTVARVLTQFGKLAEDPFPRQAPATYSGSELEITESSMKLTAMQSK